MKKDLSNAIMIFIAVAALFAVLSFMVTFAESNIKSSFDNSTQTIVPDTDSAVHTHSFVITRAPTCITPGVATCSCGNTLSMDAVSDYHEWMPADDCASKAVCDICGVEGAAGPHIDCNDDDYCDLCDLKIY